MNIEIAALAGANLEEIYLRIMNVFVAGATGSLGVGSSLALGIVEWLTAVWRSIGYRSHRSRRIKPSRLMHDTPSSRHTSGM